tara:strand:+ start:101 stop:499 length:399 start_codon:yes stop_codon:yes gene_type:complete
MTKIHQNAEKFPIQWDGDVVQVGKNQQNDNIPSNVSLVWGEVDVTWGDVNFIQEIMDGIGTGSRRARQERLNKILDDEVKKKKLIHLICRIKGEKVYDNFTEVDSVKVGITDVELVYEKIIGKIKMEIKSGI